jgi:hypothetical protein
MKSLVYNYGDMTEGSEALNSGDLSLATRIFQGILNAMGDEAPAEVYQQLDICRRLSADLTNDSDLYRQADEALELACSLVVTDFHRGQILRDWSMVAAGQRQYGLARAMLGRSYGLLHSSREFPERAAEMAVTKGFLARIYLLQGSWRNRRTARKLFREADREIYGIKPYELNHRVWAFKLLPLWYRLWWAPRTLWLAWQAGNKKRLYQVTLLVICRPLIPYFERKAKRG